MSIGGKSSKSQQYSESQSTSNRYGQNQSSSFVDPNQQPFLSGMYQNAANQFGGTAGNMAGLTNYAGQIGGAGVQNLLGLGNTNQVVGAQLEGLSSGLNDIYDSGLNRIGDNAIQGGAFGGSRQGVAEGVLGGEIGKAYTQGYGDIMANAQRQSIDANNSAVAGSGQLLANQILGDFGGLQALAGILGNPTILQQASGYDAATAQATSMSAGDSESGSFGLGFSAK